MLFIALPLAPEVVIVIVPPLIIVYGVIDVSVPSYEVVIPSSTVLTVIVPSLIIINPSSH